MSDQLLDLGCPGFLTDAFSEVLGLVTAIGLLGHSVRLVTGSDGPTR